MNVLNDPLFGLYTLTAGRAQDRRADTVAERGHPPERAPQRQVRRHRGGHASHLRHIEGEEVRRGIYI